MIEATQWFKNGDHPQDEVWREFEDTHAKPTEPREGKVVRYYRHPDVEGTLTCVDCLNTMHDHGWIDENGGWDVCPGDWIITMANGEHYPCSPEIFEQEYEKVEDGK